MKVLVAERTETGFSAHSPDVPGCIAAGPDRETVEGGHAIEFVGRW